MPATVAAAPAALQALGDPIPDTAHAVSVSLPTWRSNVGYEEGEDWVIGKMRNGYPRFFLNLAIVAFQKSLFEKYGRPGEAVLLFPSAHIARRCIDFIDKQSEIATTKQEAYLQPRILELVSQPTVPDTVLPAQSASVITAVFHDARDNSVARKFWQHTGDGVSSRRAEFFHRVFKEGHLVSKEIQRSGSVGKTSLCKGPRRYRRAESTFGTESAESSSANQSPPGEEYREDADYAKFIEERFGRNLDISLAVKAKAAVRRRIAGSLAAEPVLEETSQAAHHEETPRSAFGLTENDVFLFPTGMSAIYNTHRMLLALRGQAKSVMFGFPYTDTLKVLEKFGPGAVFYGNGSGADLEDLEQRCEAGERFLALFCEFPGNPLLKTPDLQRIRQLADKYDFAVVVDETIGNFLNINVLPAVDIVVSSLTKVFSGDCNVMAGSMVLNPRGRYYSAIRETIQTHYADHFWPEDAVFLERNSRDFVARNQRVNINAEALTEMLRGCDKVREVHYPKYSQTKPHYDAFRTPDGGYSGLLSLTLRSKADAIAFYDALATAKGPSLGTNFTLTSPYPLLAHYQELDWVQQFGVDPDLIRVSVGLEETEDLLAVFQVALDAISAA